MILLTGRGDKKVEVSGEFVQISKETVYDDLMDVEDQRVESETNHKSLDEGGSESKGTETDFEETQSHERKV